MRYDARIENGKKGGRPKKQEYQENTPPTNENELETEENFDEKDLLNDENTQNLEKPKPNLTKPNHNLEKPNHNLTKPEPNLTKPNHNLTDTVTDTVTDTDTDTVTETDTDTETDELTFSQSINENKILSKVRACGEEAEIKTLLSENFKVFFNYWGYSSEEKACFSEIMSVLSQAIKKTKEGKLRFYQTDFSQDKLLYHISLLDEEDVHKIV